MDQDRHERIFELFHAAAALPEAERESFLSRESGGDDSLVTEVVDLLAHDPGSLSPEPWRAAPELIGTVIDQYRLLEILGAGGMGEVYLAEQEEPIRRKVALKIIKLGMDTKEVIARFRSERQALALMDHANIAKIHDAGATKEGRPYFVMEFVEGIPITHYCDRHRLTTRERLGLFVLVCQAIHHAHQKGVIHRDIKPTNVLVSRQDEIAIPKVIDFGVAKATSREQTQSTVLTVQGQLVGTPEYMSPEQAEMSGRFVDTTTDVYSLGVLLYELLTGVLPFESGVLREADFDEIRRIIREDEPAKPSSRLSIPGDQATVAARNRQTSTTALAKRVRGDLDWITMRALEKDRSRRYQSASELALDIERYLRDEPVVAGPPSTTYRMTKLIKRHRRAVGTLAAIVVALAIGLGVSTTMFFRAEIAREQAVNEARKAERINTFMQEMLGSVNPAEMGKDVTVRQALDEAAERVETELTDQPEIMAEVRSTIGNTYAALGLYDAAELHLKEALATRRRVLGDDHPDVATGLHNLATLREMQGDYAEAERLVRQALSLRKAHLGEEHAGVVPGLVRLSTVHLMQGRFDDAETVGLEALRIAESAPAPDELAVAEALENLGNIYVQLGRDDKSETILQRVLAIRENAMGPDHIEVAFALNNLGEHYREHGRYGEAEPLLKRAQAIKEQVLGEDHPSIALGLTNLGNLYIEQGRYEDAEPLLERALGITEKVMGPDHPGAARVLYRLGGICYFREQLAPAERYYQRALAVWEGALGPDHPNVALALMALGDLSVEQDRPDQADSLYRRAIEIMEQALGPDHNNVAFALHGLAGSLHLQQRDAEAEAVLQRALTILEPSLPPDHPGLLQTVATYANLLRESGREQEAGELEARFPALVKPG